MFDLMKRSSTYLLVSGALALVFGIVAAMFPIGAALTLVVLWGVYALMDGVLAAAMAVRPLPGQSRGFLIVTALAGIVAGLIAVLSPVTAGFALAWVLGVWLMLRPRSYQVIVGLCLLASRKPCGMVRPASV